MDDLKPNTPEQKAMDEIFREAAAHKAQKEIDAAVGEMEKGQGNSVASKQDANQSESKADYDAKTAKDIKNDPKKFEGQLNHAKEQAAQAHHNDVSQSAAPGKEAGNQGEDNDVYNGFGMGQ